MLRELARGTPSSAAAFVLSSVSLRDQTFITWLSIYKFEGGCDAESDSGGKGDERDGVSSSLGDGSEKRITSLFAELTAALQRKAPPTPPTPVID